VRAALRLLSLLIVSLALAPVPALVVLATLGSTGPSARAGRWAMHRWSRLVCRILGVELSVVGQAPRGAFLFTSNHLGYLDIFVLGAAYPTLFLSMAEVGRWPLVGPLARLAGTLFIERKNRSDVDRVRRELTVHLSHGLPITLFPEGHASRGATVEPFHSALLEVAVQTGVRCVPVSLTYSSDGPEPSLSVCWWGDMGFVPHFRALLARRERICARVVLGEALEAGGDRKQLAERLRESVLARFERVRQAPSSAG